MVKRNPTCNRCEKCGVKLNGLSACCCSHTCAAICVKLQPESECPPPNTCECDEPQNVYVLYDSVTESYHGTISCGAASVDFDIKLKHDKELGCLACLTSSCLDFYGDNCQEVFQGTPSCIGTKDVQNGDLIGGMEFSWPITMENCGDPYCTTTFELSAKCVDRISPKEITETPYEYGCTGCECMCKELCITWMYDDGIVTCSKQRRVLFDHVTNSWKYGLSKDETLGEPDACTIEVEIYLQKNEYTGACELLIGTRSTNDYDFSFKTVALDECPFVAIQDFVLGEFETITITCHECEGCFPEKCFCECYEMPDSLTLTWDYMDALGPTCGEPPYEISAKCIPKQTLLTRPVLDDFLQNPVPATPCGFVARDIFCQAGDTLFLQNPFFLDPVVKVGDRYNSLTYSCPFGSEGGQFFLESFSCDPFELSISTRFTQFPPECTVICPDPFGPGKGQRVILTITE